MENEIWKPIIGYEGYYEVSNLGRVRRIKRGRGTQVGRLLKGWLDYDGYWGVLLTKNNKSMCYSIHRLVAKAFLPNPENKTQVNHIDGDKQNNSVTNLEWCTPKENIQHAWRTGLSIMNDKRRKDLSGRIWINNGIESRMVKPEKIQEYLNNGYVLGRLKSA